jgi:hypothetical protein
VSLLPQGSVEWRQSTYHSPTSRRRRRTPPINYLKRWSPAPRCEGRLHMHHGEHCSSACLAMEGLDRQEGASSGEAYTSQVQNGDRCVTVGVRARVAVVLVVTCSADAHALYALYCARILMCGFPRFEPCMHACDASSSTHPHLVRGSFRVCHPQCLSTALGRKMSCDRCPSRFPQIGGSIVPLVGVQHPNLHIFEARGAL